ncbi:ABC transporter permease [Mesorhizobium marinum]|uniref:ABC transporter permease n=1 Tax=Mesorhizobium marinum TaxID=3228790 RepID=UPI003466990E
MLELARSGLADLGAAIRLRNVWWELASEDIVDAHRKTLLGPIWPLLNFLLLVVALVLVLDNGGGGFSFAAYVASGMLVWFYISDVLSMSVTLFTREQAFIKGTVLPVSVYVLRQTLLVATRFLYALAGAVPILLFTGIEVTPALLSLVPAFAVMLLAAPATAVVLGIAGAYAPDLQFVVTNAVRLLMFVTPIFWTAGELGGIRGVLFHWNPFTHFIEIVRTPLIQGVVPLGSWAVVLTLTAFLLMGALFLLGKFKRLIVFQV